MGLAVSNARMLFLSDRVSNISTRMLEISNRREIAAFKTQSVFTSYQNKLNSLAQSQNPTQTASNYAKSNSAVMASTLTGAAQGTLAGAGAGAAIGTCILPGPGTLIGGAIGAGVGAVLGGISGFFSGKAADDGNAKLAAKLDQVANLNKQNVYNETQLKQAEAEYQGNMNRVHSADSALEQQQKQLETQLKAAQVELESVEKQRDKEVQGKSSGFQCFG